MMQDKRRKLTEERQPPYVSYRQWQKFLDALKAFIPSRIDVSYFDDLRISGSGRSMLRGALLFLGLMSPDGTPTKRLKELVNSDAEARPKVLEGIVRDAYAPLFSELDLAHASRGQIKEYLEREGVAGDIGRKCWGFFRAIAAEAGIQLSPRIERSNHGRKLDKTRLEDMPRHRLTRTTPGDTSWIRALVEKFPNFDPQWPDELKKKWFDDFRELQGALRLSRQDMAIVGRGSRTRKT